MWYQRRYGCHTNLEQIRGTDEKEDIDYGLHI